VGSGGGDRRSWLCSAPAGVWGGNWGKQVGAGWSTRVSEPFGCLRRGQKAQRLGSSGGRGEAGGKTSGGVSGGEGVGGGFVRVGRARVKKFWDGSFQKARSRGWGRPSRSELWRGGPWALCGGVSFYSIPSLYVLASEKFSDGRKLVFYYVGLLEVLSFNHGRGDILMKCKASI